jgi:hypothetical protein
LARVRWAATLTITNKSDDVHNLCAYDNPSILPVARRKPKGPREISLDQCPRTMTQGLLARVLWRATVHVNALASNILDLKQTPNA